MESSWRSEQQEYDVTVDLYVLSREETRSWNVALDITQSSRYSSGIGFFEKNSTVYFMARVLQNLLKREIFKLGQLETPEIYLNYRILKQDFTLQNPPDWKKNLFLFRIDLNNFGTHGEAFVVWGREMKYGQKGSFQPFIVLANLGPLIRMEELHAKGLDEQIKTFLKLWLRGYESADTYGQEVAKKMSRLSPLIEPSTAGRKGAGE